MGFVLGIIDCDRFHALLRKSYKVLYKPLTPRTRSADSQIQPYPYTQPIQTPAPSVPLHISPFPIYISFPLPRHNPSKISNPPIIAPIPPPLPTPPPQRLILRPPHLPRLRIDLPFKLRRRAPPHIRMKLLALLDLLAVLEPDRLALRRAWRGGGVWGLVDLHAQVGCGGWWRGFFGLAECSSGLLLQLLEQLLFFLGQAGRCRTAEEGG